MRINWDKYPDCMYISKKVLNEYPFGHIQTTTYGPKRSGKSVFTLRAMCDQYAIIWPEDQYGYGIDWRFSKALDNTIYTISDLIDKTERLQKKYDTFQGGDTPLQYTKRAIAEGFPEVAVHIDDGGVGFNKYIYFTDRNLVEELKNYMDTVGIVITWLTVSTPSIEGVLNFVRKYEGWITHIIKLSSDFRRMAKHYKVLQLPSGTQRIKQPKGDPFDAWLEEDLYKKYRKKRGTYLKMNVARLKEIQKKLKDARQRDPGLDADLAGAVMELTKLKEDNIV